jgi:hypothetical protein
VDAVTTTGTGIVDSTMLSAKLEGVDRNLIFEFFCKFSKFECALKRADFFEKVNNGGPAIPDWERFGDEIKGKFDTVSVKGFKEAVARLQQLAPQRQAVLRGRIRWSPVKRVGSDEQYTLQLLKTARNNLFHGGKYQDGPIHEIARDREILRAGVTILDGCYELHAVVKRWIDKAA